MKKEDKSLIDVENVETTGERCCHHVPSELTNTIEQFLVYVHRNEAPFTYIVYIIPMYSRLPTFTKTLPQMSFPLKKILFFRSGASPMTLLTAGALIDPHMPATASNVCTNDVRLGDVGRVPPPNKNPGYAGVLGGR